MVPKVAAQFLRKWEAVTDFPLHGFGKFFGAKVAGAELQHPGARKFFSWEFLIHLQGIGGTSLWPRL
jgi:hypothetical protein